MTDDYRESNYGRDDDICANCYGTRQVDGSACLACDGSGFTPEYEDDEYRD